MPQNMPGAWARLVTELRALKDRRGLNLADLASATAISKSSWERYLNGKQFPPLYAVQALCQVVKEGETECVGLWKLADAAWGRRGHSLTPRGSTSSPEQPKGRGVWHALLLAASRPVNSHPKTTAAVVALICAAMLVPAALIHAARTSAASPSAMRPPVCRLQACEGRNPRTTACEDPVTLAKHTAADGTRLEIRVSPSCRAGWIRAWPTHAGFRLEISGPQAHAQRTADTGRSADQQLITTKMIAAPSPSHLRACYYPARSAPGEECFSGGD
ncbi:helix-turn-helix domain-containing protein [Streptomyces misionensis]|uniref:helix-turn-helix domain-containing protein n=1 Tax=Streptomyces misionensis TaxID=67331 RepID=UPI0021BD0756|nr:DUF2690 domain-containing protein [Streptomyces misionensis]